MALEKRHEIAGLPVHYDRFNADGSDYGTRGKPISPLINARFAEDCDLAIEAVANRLHPKFGATEVLVTGGIARSGTGRSLHHRNRAFDLDALAFESGDIWVADSFPYRPHLYLAIESELRVHFGTVLTFGFNKAHQDHIHFDNGKKPGFRPDTRTHPLYVQNALNLVFQQPVAVDGMWGPDTESAVDEVLDNLGLGDLDDKKNWAQFCKITAEEALRLAD